MDCPICKTDTLRPARIDGLLMLSCTQCDGCQIDLLSYRNWRETQPLVTTEETIPNQQAHNTQTALCCAKCKRIMTKYRINQDLDNTLDLCATCGEIWLDHGEWHLLQNLNLRHAIPSILSTPWQNQIKQQTITEKLERCYIEEIGEYDFAKLQQIKRWLSEHPKSELLRHLLLKKGPI